MAIALSTTLASDLMRLISLQDATTRTVLLGTGVLGLACGVVGAFAVLRKRALMTDAVSHASLPGVCAAYFVVGERHFAAFLVGALVFGLLAAAFVSLVKSQTRVKPDAAIAIAIGAFFGLGIVWSSIIQRTPGGNRAGLDGFLFGKAATMVRGDAMLILAVSSAALAAIALLYKEFKLLCFDKEYAHSQGWPTTTLDLSLMALVTVCTVVGLPAVGVVLMVALLAVPAAAARFWTDRLGPMLFIAGGFGLIAGVVGTGMSAVLPAANARGWPTGPLITLTAAGVFFVSMLVAPRRGVVARLVSRVTLSRRIAIQNLLRSAYEFHEIRGDRPTPGESDRIAWKPGMLSLADSMGERGLARLHSRGEGLGLVARRGEGWSLTSLGCVEAAQVVRAHRVWEAYLISHANIAPDHVDRDADEIEHLLPPEVLAQIEERLRREGRLPESVPSSPHGLAYRGPGGGS